MFVSRCVVGIVICFTFILTAICLAQDAYYYGKSVTVPLWYSHERILVKLVEGGLDGGGFFHSDPAFDTTQAAEPAPYGFYFVYLVPETDIDSLMNRLDTNSQVEVASPIYFTSDSVEHIPTDGVVVEFKPEVSQSSIDSMNQANQVTIAETWKGCGNVNWYLLKITQQTSQRPLDIANIYEQSSLTEFSVVDFLARVEPDYQPSDSFFYGQWNFHDTGQYGLVDADIDAKEGWEWGLGDSSIIIAVVDAGVQKTHEDFIASKIVRGYDFAWQQPYNTSSAR